MNPARIFPTPYPSQEKEFRHQEEHLTSLVKDIDWSVIKEWYEQQKTKQ